MLLAIGTPTLLFSLVVAKLDAVHRAAIYGDYLYFKQYDVPHYFAKDSARDPTGSLLVGTFFGNKQAKTRQQRLTQYQLSSISRQTLVAGRVCRYLVGSCVALAVGPLISRLVGLATRLTDQPEPTAWQVPLVLAMAALIAFFAYHTVSEIDDRFYDPARRGLGDTFLQWSWFTRGRLGCSLAGFVLAHAWAAGALLRPLLDLVLRRQVEDNALNRKRWALAGLVLFLAVMRVLMLKGRPVRMAVMMKSKDASPPPSEYISVARNHPEFDLGAEQDMAEAFLQSNPLPHEKEAMAAWRSEWQVAVSRSSQYALASSSAEEDGTS